MAHDATYDHDVVVGPIVDDPELDQQIHGHQYSTRRKVTSPEAGKDVRGTPNKGGGRRGLHAYKFQSYRMIRMGPKMATNQGRIRTVRLELVTSRRHPARTLPYPS